MKILDIIVLFAAVFTLVFGIYAFLSLSVPGEKVEYKTTSPSSSNDLSAALYSSAQFYPNMRFQNKEISYTIGSACDEKKKKNVQEAFSILSQETMLSFSESPNGEIDILCSQVSPESGEEGHFVAGEGGPSEIINATKYYIILKGKVSLYRDEKCKTPNIALHEILHALGFDHNTNENSIMYPVTSCNQEFDSYIAQEINRLYAISSDPDLVVERVNANRTGRYMYFKAIVANYGLKDAGEAKLVVFVDGENIKEFDLGLIQIGTKKSIEVTNLRMPAESENITFSAFTNQSKELSYENNNLKLVVVK